MANRLVAETSPYLLQHKDNPVDWYPWGEDALAEARARAKPILLSIGYAACHWCHVMERESFEDPETARLMNESFVCIKVDREERPDLDALYMEAVQTITGQGGWPMTVFLTPEGVPFYGGTYFPPEDRHGMPSFRRLLTAITELWRERRAEAEEHGRTLMSHLGGMSGLVPSDDPVTDDVLRSALDGLAGSFDARWGGFGNAPKFPQPMTIDFLHRMAARGFSGAHAMARGTLDAMAAGGMLDQLGGGFARYSVDRQWVVPHFEKMLYDNAQLLRTYARSWQLSRNERHRDVAVATAEWMLAEMRDPSGGFWSSIDADSEGEEGKFYVWDRAEFQVVTGADAPVAAAHWGVTEQGNFEGKNILVYADHPTDPDAIERARKSLLARRSERRRPGTDTKVLAAWNGLAASCLAEAGWVLDRTDWVTAAAEAMTFVLSTMRVDGRLMRSYRRLDDGGDVRHLGFCDDYAFTLEACLALYETTFEPSWLAEARWAADEATRLFLDTEGGGFFTTGADGEKLVMRSKDLIDNAIPAANSVMALELQRLALITGVGDYEHHAREILTMMQPAIASSPGAFGHLLGAVDMYTGTPLEIVIVGTLDHADTTALVDAIRSRYLADRVIVVSAPPHAVDLPLLEKRAMTGGVATAYVCRRGVCKVPVTDPDELLAQLAA
jgi:uncharacterized protein YyaL (SSP411 family)